jgi:hypothetical protein
MSLKRSSFGSPASLLRLAVFADVDGASEAAERAEPLADWDSVIACAMSRPDAEDKVQSTLGDNWLKGYAWSDLMSHYKGVVYWRLTPEDERQ